jgi:hypothetical protein
MRFYRQILIWRAQSTGNDTSQQRDILACFSRPFESGLADVAMRNVAVQVLCDPGRASFSTDQVLL